MTNSNTQIYLQIFDQNVDYIVCPVYTGIVLFVTRYCDIHKEVDFILVECPSKDDAVVPQGSMRLCGQAIAGLHCSTTTSAQVSNKVLRCSLPVAVTLDGKIFHSGLCSVLRLMLKQFSVVKTDLLPLLGFRESCLRACAEVSAWTKFCEVDFPKIMVEALEDTNCSIIPTSILKLENHLRQPAVIQNVGKRKRQILQEKLQSLDFAVSKRNIPELTTKMRNMQVNNENFSDEALAQLTTIGKVSVSTGIEQLEHVYAEGTDFTLTDLILFPCMASFLKASTININNLCSKIPSTITWFKRVGAKEEIKMAAKQCGIDVPSCDTSKQVLNRTLPSEPELDETLPCVNSRTDIKVKVKVTQSELVELQTFMKEKRITVEEAPHPCSGSVRLTWDDMPATVHPAQGELPVSRIQRKCEQLESIAVAVRHISQPGDVIVDFCSGGGHLGLLIAYLLPECQVLLVENKEESIIRGVRRLEKLGLTNVTVYQGNLDYFHGDFDIGVCLHACGVATDLVLNRCLNNHANFVLCPCCYGAIQNGHTVTYPRSERFRQAGVSYEIFSKLAHSADRAEEGKTFMNMVDYDRSLVATELGYSVTLCSLHPLTCSPKNNLLIGVLDRQPSK